MMEVVDIVQQLLQFVVVIFGFWCRCLQQVFDFVLQEYFYVIYIYCIVCMQQGYLVYWVIVDVDVVDVVVDLQLEVVIIYVELGQQQCVVVGIFELYVVVGLVYDVLYFGL